VGFLDRAKAGANDLAARAANGGDTERHLRDLSALAYLKATGRPAPSRAAPGPGTTAVPPPASPPPKQQDERGRT